MSETAAEPSPDAGNPPARGRRRGPSLIDASRLAGRIVWRSARKPFLVSTLAEGVAAVALAGVLLFGRDLATALTGEAPVDELRDVLPEALGLAGALLVSGVAAIVVRQVRWLVAEQVTRHVKEEIGAVASSVDYERYEEAEFHDLLSRSEEQASESSYQLVFDLLSLVNIVGTSVVVLIVLVGAVPEVLPALLLIAVPSVIAARASARHAFQTTYDLTPNDRLRTDLFSALTGKATARELRVFGIAGLVRSRWERLYDERMDRIRALVTRQVVFNGLAVLVGALLVGAVLLVLVQAAIADRISLADAAIAIVALQQLTARLRTAASASGSLRQSTLFLEDFERFRGMRRPDPANHVASAPLERAPLVVESVSFTYPGTHTPVLDDVSLEVAPGEIVALVGVSGSGKTTLAQLLAGLYRPTAGRITFGGADISDIPEHIWWRSLAVVFQDFVRYELSARDNITISDHWRAQGDATEDAVNDAADRAGIGAVLRGLPHGYDTMLSRAYEEGAELSVGQWQRVAVARAYFRDAPMLILDEPASALDAIAEQELHDRLVALCAKRSVLLISHRFSTVRMAHRICVLDRGRLVEEGTHDELMELGARYAQLFGLQASSYIGDGLGSTPPTGS